MPKLCLWKKLYKLIKHTHTTKSQKMNLRGSQRVGLFLKSCLVTMKAFYSPSHGCLVLFWRTLAVKEEAETIPFHACKEPLIIYSEYNILKHPTSTCGQQTKMTLQHFVFRNDKNTFLDRKVRATPQPHPVLSLVLSRKCWSADKEIPNFLAQRTLGRPKLVQQH